jgi:hypothetical protein
MECAISTAGLPSESSTEFSISSVKSCVKFVNCSKKSEQEVKVSFDLNSGTRSYSPIISGLSRMLGKMEQNEGTNGEEIFPFFIS